MAATADVRILLECAGLGSGTHQFGEKWTDTNTPDDFKRIETVISTTAVLLSTLTNKPSNQVKGIALKARGDAVYLNTISTTVSTAGLYVPENQGAYLSFKDGNSCVITLLGAAADAAITALIFATATATA